MAGMRVRGGRALAGAMLLAGCGAPHSSGVLPLDPGNYGLTVTSRSLGIAAELALSEATGFCTRQGEQTQLLRTQINSGDYQLVFRCIGAVVPERVAGRPPGFEYGGPALSNAPVLTGQAFAKQAPPLLPEGSPRMVASQAGLGPSGLPQQPPTSGALMAAARQQARLEAPPAGRDWFSRVFGADDAPSIPGADPSRSTGFASPSSFGPSPLPAGMQPFRIPEPLPAVALSSQPVQAPFPVAPFVPPLPSSPSLAPPPPPLQSPLAQQPVFAPLPASALIPAAALRSFESLPPVTGLPGGPPHRMLTPLPPIGERLPQRALVTEVPPRLPPPATNPAVPEAAGAADASLRLPAAFWDLRRN